MSGSSSRSRIPSRPRRSSLRPSRSLPSPSQPPDLAAPIVGWRAWAVAVRAGRARLLSPVYDVSWEPRAPLEAVCPQGHRAPAVGCRCGIHAARAPDAAAVHLVGRDDADVVHRVLGEVALWGTVVEAEHGWRGELAYPARLFVPSRHADGSPADVSELARLLAAYGVPAVLAERERLGEVFLGLREPASQAERVPKRGGSCRAYPSDQ